MECKCRGSGYITKIVDGEEITTYCDCKMKEEIKRTLRKKYDKAGIPVDYWDLEIGRDYKNLTPTNIDSLKKINKYVLDLNKTIENGKVLYLYGDNNSGKTMIECCILKEAIKKDYSAKFITMAQLVNIAIQAMGKDDAPRNKLDELTKCDIVGIDDAFDTEKVYISDNGIQNAKMDDVFRTLVHNKKSIIVTANVNVDGISERFSKNIIELLKRKMESFQFTGRFYEHSTRS